ncbi:MAG: PD-(D/E)XK nuclease family protein, partial [archaeon]|nr:PD-(D/E)XK nuclease family protein [archaeon]
WESDADRDAQLAMYALWVKMNSPDAKGVVLVWYMLKKSGDEMVLTSKRNQTQLNKLEKETVLRIRDIECTEDFPMVRSKLCHWCMYEKLCSGSTL